MEILHCRMQRNRCACYLRILDNMHQGRGGLHELQPQRTARAHAVDGQWATSAAIARSSRRRRATVCTRSCRSRCRGGESSFSSTEFDFLAGAELLCRRELSWVRARSKCRGLWQSKREGHALLSDGSGGQSFPLFHLPLPIRHCRSGRAKVAQTRHELRYALVLEHWCYHKRGGMRL